MSLLILFPAPPALPPEQPPVEAADGSIRVEMQFTPGIWEVNEDVDGDEDLTFRRGIAGNGPNDRVAGPGTLSFALLNDPEGYYSPHHSGHRSGFREGMPVRVVCRVDEVDYILWTGKLANIEPEPGARSFRTHCQATSGIADLLEEKLRAIAPQLNQTEVQLLNAVLQALPTDVRPASVMLDEAVDAYPFAFDDLETGTMALTVINNIMLSARGFWFERGDGTQQYVNYISRSLALSRFAFGDDTLEDLQRPSSRDQVFKRVRVQTHAKKVSDTNTEVLCRHEGELALAPGQSVEFFLEYSDLTDARAEAVGGTDFFNNGVLIPGTDVRFYDGPVTTEGQPEPTVNDITASIAVTTSPFVSSCKFVLTNTGAVPAYKDILQLRGRTVRDLSPVWAEASAPGPTNGVAVLEVDQPYQDDAVVGFELATYLAAQYSDLSRQINTVEFLANVSAELLQQAVEAEIGDVVTVSEARTGTNLVDGYIQWIEWNVKKGGLMHVRYGLAPRIESQQSQGEDLTVADVLAVVSDPPESRVDFALVEFSEVG
jgi:hypothetical protein